MSRHLRLAGRVCLALGIDDPERWLHEATPRKVAFWEAFFRVEPWGNEQFRGAVVSAQLDALRATVAATVGSKSKVASVADFMPHDWAERPPKVRVDSKAIRTFQSWASKYKRD